MQVTSLTVYSWKFCNFNQKHEFFKDGCSLTYFFILLFAGRLKMLVLMDAFSSSILGQIRFILYIFSMESAFVFLVSLLLSFTVLFVVFVLMRNTSYTFSDDWPPQFLFTIWNLWYHFTFALFHSTIYSKGTGNSIK